MPTVPTSPLAAVANPRNSQEDALLINRVIGRVRYATGGPKPDAGFTVLEVLVSFVIFAVVATSATYGTIRALNASHDSQQRVDAANVAQAFIAQAISNATTIAPEQGRTVTSNVGSGTTSAREEFTVIRWITFAQGQSSCTPGTTFAVNVEVHQAQSGKFLARSDSFVACPPA